MTSQRAGRKFKEHLGAVYVLSPSRAAEEKRGGEASKARV